MSDQPPFKPGDRIRIKQKFIGLRMKHRTGTVSHLDPGFDSGAICVNYIPDTPRKCRTYFFIYPEEECEWELIPLHDLSEDTVAVLLAKAVLAGDINAARPLADRVFEICGATPAAHETKTV